jgi:hypothetical protein
MTTDKAEPREINCPSYCRHHRRSWPRHRGIVEQDENFSVDFPAAVYVRQCLECGKPVSTASEESARDGGRIPQPFDVELYAAGRKKEEAADAEFERLMAALRERPVQDIEIERLVQDIKIEPPPPPRARQLTLPGAADWPRQRDPWILRPREG